MTSNLLRPLLVACDESGNDGENVLSGSSPVFAHASVTLSEEVAVNLMDEIRGRTRSSAVELKSRIFLQGRHEDTARWLLRHSALEQQASIHVTHKRFFLVTKLFDSTVEELAHELGEEMYESGGALAGATILHFLAPGAYGESWDRLLNAFQYFLRSKDAQEAQEKLVDVVATVQALLRNEGTPLRDLIGPMYAGLKHLESLSKLQLGKGIEARLRTGDPLLAAVGATVMHWAHVSGRPVHLVHDTAKELSAERVKALQYHLARPELVSEHRRGAGCELVGVDLVDSVADSRIQIADLLAGLARMVSESLIAGKNHPLVPEVSALMSHLSIWPVPEHLYLDNARETMIASRIQPN